MRRVKMLLKKKKKKTFDKNELNLPPCTVVWAAHGRDYGQAACTAARRGGHLKKQESKDKWLPSLKRPNDEPVILKTYRSTGRHKGVRGHEFGQGWWGWTHEVSWTWKRLNFTQVILWSTVPRLLIRAHCLHIQISQRVRKTCGNAKKNSYCENA